jgi:hypothetical protein
VIPARELVSAEAFRRYDDDGEPVYTPTERVLMALRWFGWVSADDLWVALDMPEAGTRDRNKHAVTLCQLVKKGRVLAEGSGAARRYSIGILRSGRQAHREQAAA